MKNKILKYIEFIKEELKDTAPSYIKGKLQQLQKAFDDLFDEESLDDNEEPENISIEDAKNNKKSDKKLSDLGVKKDSSEISLYSSSNDSLTIKYSDEEASYTIIIFINISNGIPKDDNFSEDDINKIDVKFKKYLNAIDLVGTTRYLFNVDRVDGEFMFSKSEEKEEEEIQGQNNQEKVQDKQESDVDKMNIIEFLEFLKSDFDEKYGDNKGLEIETK
jgi:hypothetical protein